MAAPMRLALATERPVVGNIDANIKTLEKRVKAAKADVVLFGELFVSGYMARDRFTHLAMSMKGDEVGRIRDIAKDHGKAIIAGFPRRDDTIRGVVYDSALFVDKKGKTDYYDKWFLANFGPFEEKLFFGQGRRLPIWDVDGFKFGPQICYDLFFPELAKAYALLGADCLVNVSASPNVSRKNFEILFPARAVENGYFVAYCNVAGTQEDLVFWGGSQVWGPRGDQKIIAPYTDPSFVTVEIDEAEITAARPLRPTLRDTRDDMASALVDALAKLKA
jgi:5-aminopentanamidase